MYILGVNFLSEASVVLLKDGKILSAISEERLNRKKLWHGYPRMAIEWTLKYNNISFSDIDLIATTGEAPSEPPMGSYRKKETKILASTLSVHKKEQQIQALWNRYKHEKEILSERTPKNIEKLKTLGPKVQVFKHHLAHAASAYFSSGWNKSIIITADGWGENASHTISIGDQGKITPLHSSNTFDSLGYYYGSMTKFLGYRPHRHEGKILGLAAFGDPTHTAPIMRKMIGVDLSKKKFIGKIEEGIYLPRFDNPNLAETFTVGEVTNHEQGIYTREDIAAGLQLILEETVTALVRSLRYTNMHICLAGGIFANVKLNQKIRELPHVSNIFIYPNMGDGGLAAGSALYAYSLKEKLLPKQITHSYYGPSFSDEEIETEIKKHNLTATKCGNIAKEVGTLLSQNKVVALFTNKMEWGPRALGSRSILYSPVDKSVNDWLNKRLQRTEFMPFAPVTLAEHAHECYVGYDSSHIAASFMTITYNCTEQMKQEQPAVVHVDGTARPQIITREQNEVYYDILKEFHSITNIPSIVNTSFNMHEEPIVCSPFDAIRAFLAGHLDYLAIGNYLIEHQLSNEKPNKPKPQKKPSEIMRNMWQNPVGK